MKFSFNIDLKNASISELAFIAGHITECNKLHRLARMAVKLEEASPGNIDVFYLKTALAENDCSDSRVLELLSKDSDPLIRECVVKAHNTPTSVLDALMYDTSFEVARSYPLAHNVSKDEIGVMLERIISGDVDITDTFKGDIVSLVRQYQSSKYVDEEDKERLGDWLTRTIRLVG